MSETTWFNKKLQEKKKDRGVSAKLKKDVRAIKRCINQLQCVILFGS